MYPILTWNATTNGTKEMWIVMLFAFFSKLSYQYLLSRLPQSVQVLLGIVVISIMQNWAEAMKGLTQRPFGDEGFQSPGTERKETYVFPRQERKAFADADADSERETNVSPETMAWNSIRLTKITDPAKVSLPDLAKAKTAGFTSDTSFMPGTSKTGGFTSGRGRVSASFEDPLGDRRASDASEIDSPRDVTEEVGRSDDVDKLLFVATSEGARTDDSSQLPGKYPKEESGQTTEQNETKSSVLRANPDRVSSGKVPSTQRLVELVTNKQSRPQKS